MTGHGELKACWGCGGGDATCVVCGGTGLVSASPHEGDAHDLMPDWLAAQLPALYSQEGIADPAVQAKFFTPDSSWTWYVIEYSPAERLCFGLVDGHEQELGYFSVEELESVRGPLGLRIERDLYWKPCPLSQVRTK